MPILSMVLLGLAIGAYCLFNNSMNLFQKVGRVYWITRNNMRRKQPLVWLAFLQQDAPPYWMGRGIQFAWRRWSFQIGIITGKNPSFNPNVYFADSKLRSWKDMDEGKEVNNEESTTD